VDFLLSLVIIELSLLGVTTEAPGANIDWTLAFLNGSIWPKISSIEGVVCHQPFLVPENYTVNHKKVVVHL